MNVEFISGILAGAAGTAHAERGRARPGSVRGAAGSPRALEQAAQATESVGQSLETCDRDADGRQPWSARQPDPLEVDEASPSPAPTANSASRGERLDLIG